MRLFWLFRWSAHHDNSTWGGRWCADNVTQERTCLGEVAAVLARSRPALLRRGAFCRGTGTEGLNTEQVQR